MLILVIGLIVILGIHLLPTNTALRNGLVERFGAQTFKLGFSLISLIGFAVIVYGFYKLQMMPGKNPQIWDPPLWLRHVTLFLMLPAMIFLVASQIPSRVRTALKHPMLLAIKTWALAHLLANGDLASMLIFASFLAFAVFDMISVKKRAALGPLGDRSGGLMNDVVVIGLGVALYVVFVLWAHEWLIGVRLV